MSETAATAFSFVALILVVLVPYWWWVKRSEQSDRKRQIDARRHGHDKVIAQHPLINQSSCIGCASCVLACPEHALGMIDGIAELVQPARCVGHGICADACPVSAIRIVLDPAKSTAEIPDLDANFQSNIPNLYLIGELGGMALIRNAIHQGRVAVEHIAVEVHKKSRSVDALDLVIVGAGPSGLSASLQAMEHGLNFVVLEKESSPGGAILSYPRQKLVMTVPVEIPKYGWLRKRELSKEELLALWSDILQKTQPPICCNEKVDHISRNGELLTTHTNSGRQYVSNHVILALGRRGTPRKLGVPGEDSPKVAYQLIEAVKYAHKRLLIVGAGDSAIEAALGLANQKGTTVTMVIRGDDFPSAKPKNRDRVKEAAFQGKIRILFEAQVTRILPDEVETTTSGGTERIGNDFVFIFAGGEMPVPFLKKIGVSFVRRERTIAA